jgi:hypothetical protein
VLSREFAVFYDDVHSSEEGARQFANGIFAQHLYGIRMIATVFSRTQFA